MLKLWGRPSAYNFQKVHWFLEELGIEYEHINVGGAVGGLDTESFLTMNPNGRIPVIQDQGEYIWESNSILRYLAATYGSEHYWNDSPLIRAGFEKWMDWELSALQPVFLDLFWGYYRTPVQQRDEAKIDHLRERCAHYVAVLDKHLGTHAFVSGHAFGLGDICVGTCFYRYFTMGLKVAQPHNVMRWYGQLSERPKYQQIIGAPFDELKGRLTF